METMKQKKGDEKLLKNTPKKEASKVQEIKNADVNEQIKKISNIVNPTAKGRISKLETLNILAEKHKNATAQYDELTNFIASNDNTSGQMKFAFDSNYSFTVKNPVIINEILVVVEKKLAEILEQTESEVLTFQI